MKVTCTEQEITSFHKTLVIEHEGKTYKAELVYNEYSNYDLRFYDEEGSFMEMPEWAEDFDNAHRSLDFTLDNITGSWDYENKGEVEVAV